MSEPTPLLAPLKPVLVTARLWKDGRFVADDWRALADGEPLPIEDRAIVSLGRWRAERANLAALGAQVGIRLEPPDEPDPIADDITRLGVIALTFQKFTDGRAYSTARRLRESGYKGELRASGDVLLDQLPLMLRAGFDAFEIRHRATIAALEAAQLPAVSRVYQSGAEFAARPWRSRRAAAGAAGQQEE
jgi:uncharacterized protein (DUF934 family)